MPKKFRHRNRDESGCPQNSNSSSFKTREDKIRKGYLAEDVISYYRQVSTTLQTGFDDEEGPEVKTQFISNVVDAIREEGVTVSQNQTVSRILEFVFTHSPPHLLRPVFDHFCTQLPTVVFDAFASHVFQALIQYLAVMYQQGDMEDSDDFDKKMISMKDSVEQLCTFVETHMRDIMTHVYGSHVLRSLLEVLGGVAVRAEIVRSRMSRKASYKDVGHGPEVNKAASKQFSENNKDWFQKIAAKIIHLCNYEDNLIDQNFCPLLQTLLLILHKTCPAQYQDLADSILQKSCAEPDIGIRGERSDFRLPAVAQSEVGSYLLELLVSLARGERFEALYTTLFQGHLLQYAVHPCANYVLQRLLATIDDPVLMRTVLTDMCAYVEDILAVNHCGLVTALATAVCRTGEGQGDFVQVLMAAFHCKEPESRQSKIVPLLASFKTYEVYYECQEGSQSENKALSSCSIHGSLLLQQLLQFSDPVVMATIVTSLLGLSQTELLCLACDKCGSHTVDVFMHTDSVRGEHKAQMVRKLQGVYLNMACNRVGSRCLENIWKYSTMPQRVLIAEDLCQGQERLEGDHIGRFVYKNFALSKFMNRRKEWKEIQGITAKKQQMLKSILEGEPSKKKRKKKTDAVSKKEVPMLKQEPSSEQKLEGVPLKKINDKKKEKKVDKDVVNTYGSEQSQKEPPVFNSVENNKKNRKRKKEKKRTIRADENLDVKAEQKFAVKKRKTVLNSGNEQTKEENKEAAVKKKKKNRNKDNLI